MNPCKVLHSREGRNKPACAFIGFKEINNISVIGCHDVTESAIIGEPKSFGLDVPIRKKSRMGGNR